MAKKQGTLGKIFGGSRKKEVAEEKLAEKSAVDEPLIICDPDPVQEKSLVLERYDGPFPAGMFIDLDDPKHIWHGDHWKNGDVVRDPLRGQRLGGKPGTKFEGCVYNWDGCFWERPVIKK